MFEKYKGSDPEVMKALSLIAQLGTTMVASIVIFLLIGRWLDKIMATTNTYMIIAIAVGLASGIYLNYRLLRRYYEDR